MATRPSTDVGVALSELERRMTKVELRRRGFATNSVVTSFPTYAQDTMPSGTGYSVGSIWYDTSNNNTTYRWDGSGWVPVIDPSVDDGRDAASTDLALAEDQDGSPDQKITTSIRSTAPAVGPVGDLWVDTDDNHLYRSNGAAWVDTGDTSVGASIRRPENASTIADGRVQTWWQFNPPTPDGYGDMWVNTAADPQILYRWNNYDWVQVPEFTAAKLSGIVQTKSTTFHQPGPPTATATGDLWFDTANGNIQYRAAAPGANGISPGGWVLVQDTAIPAAQETADHAVELISTRNGIYYNNVTAGDPVPVGVNVGDTWYKPDEGYAVYKWNGTAWEEVKYGSEVFADGSVTSQQLADDAVTVSKLADNSVDIASIIAGAVTEAALANNAVTGPKIADSAVTAQQLADNAVTVGKLADDSVDTNAIIDSAVTSLAIASGAVQETNLANNAVSSVKLGPGSVTSTKILDGAVVEGKLANLSVATANIQPLAVTTTQLADYSVGTVKLVDNAVAAEKLADSAVQIRHISDGAVTTSALAPGAVTTSKISDFSVPVKKLLSTQHYLY